MKIKPTLSICGTAIFAILSVVVLGASVGIFKQSATGFERKFIARNLNLIHELRKPEEVNEIISITNGIVYFKTDTPGRIFQVDLRNYNNSFLDYNFPPTAHRSGNFQYSLEKTFKIIFSTRHKTIYQSEGDNTLNVAKIVPSIFTRSVAISPTSYVLRMFNPILKERDQTFVKVNAENSFNYYQGTPIFNDGGIKTDGQLKFDRSTHLLTYTYYYSNKILCMDTNLVPKFILNTIDTFASFYNTGGEIKKSLKNSKFTNVKPARIINIAQCTNQGKLYNLSAIKADNESIGVFKENSVLDIYNLSKQKYLGSLYLPNVNLSKVRSFSVFGNILVAQYKSNVAIFSLPHQLL